MAKFYRSEDKTVLLEVFGAGSSIENLKSLKANTTDAAVEKHLPVVTQEGNKITVASSVRASNASRTLYYGSIY